jgi:hypothetical protein
MVKPLFGSTRDDLVEVPDHTTAMTAAGKQEI